MRVKSPGVPPGLTNAQPQGLAKFANAAPPPTPRTYKARKCPAVAWGG